MGITLKNIAVWWKFYVTVLVPFLLLPLVFNSLEGKCAYMMAIMAMYWVTEAIPLGVTALIPIFLTPMLGIMPSSDICPIYFKSTNLLFIGGLMMAVCIEKWKLHRRIALKVLLLVGTSARWLLFGFMVPTWFLSMWISNTATTAMMSPMAHAVLEQVENTKKKISKNKVESIDLKDRYVDENDGHPVEFAKCQNGDIDYGTLDKDSTDPEITRLYKSILLSIAYAANAGGIATLTGTGPNLVLKGQIDLLFGGVSPITFATWMGFALPISVLSLAFGWIWLQILFTGFRNTFLNWRESRNSNAVVHKIIQDEYDKLGPMGWPDTVSLALFVLLAILWFSRKPEFIPGWGDLFLKDYVDDATAAILVAVLLFCVPGVLPKCSYQENGRSTATIRLLDWRTVGQNLPWDIVLLLGGGFALAAASEKSGLSKMIGESMSGLGVLPPWVMVLIICTIIAVLTEITSNTATSTLMMPILSQLAQYVNVHPIYLMLPAAISASFAFMLPVATPPNAIVFASGHLRIVDMMKAGAVMNVGCIFIVTVAINTWGYALFDLSTLPDWMLQINGTTVEALNVTTFSP